MKGVVNGQPYIDLDQHIDMSILDIEEIELGISVAPAKIITYFGPGTDPAYNDIAKYLYNKPEGLSAREERLWAMQGERPNCWRTYVKLKYGAFSGAHVIPLTMMRKRGVVHNHQLIDDGDAFEEVADNMRFFPSVKRLLETGFMSTIGRVIFFLREHSCPIPLHSDNPNQPFNQPNPLDAVSEFVWISPRQVGNFFIYDEMTDERHYVRSKTAWFNSYDKHGSDPHDRMSWSLRIDGKFSPELREKIGVL